MNRALAVIALLLVLWIWYQWRQPTEPVLAAPEPSAVEVPETPGIDFDRLPPIDAFSEMVERPLFTPSRHPSRALGEAPGPGTVAVAEDSDGIDGFILTGITVVGDSKRALLHGPGNNEFVKLAIGESIGDWRLDAIDDSAVRLSNPAGEHLELQLRLFDEPGYARPPREEDAAGVRELLGPDGALVADPDKDDNEAD
jgi:hypothetical protein